MRSQIAATGVLLKRSKMLATRSRWAKSVIFESLLERYRPDLLPRMPNPKVTPFKSPGGGG